MFISGRYYQGNNDSKPEQWGSISDVQYAVRHWCEEWLGVSCEDLVIAIPGWTASNKALNFGFDAPSFTSQFLYNAVSSKKYGIDLTNRSLVDIGTTFNNADGDEFSIFIDSVKRGSSTTQSIVAGWNNSTVFGYIGLYPNLHARLRFGTHCNFTAINKFNTRNRIVFTCGKNMSVKAFQEGTFRQEIIQTNTAFSLNQLGTNNRTYGIDDATVYNFLVFSAALNNKQVELLSGQPSKLFEPILRPLYFDFTDLPEPSISSFDTSWKIKNIANKNSSFKIYGQNDKSLSWKLINEKSSDLSWLIFDLSEKETTWRVLNLKEQEIDCKIFNEQTNNISFKILNEKTKQTQYKILNQTQKEIAWKILSSGILTQDVSWKILKDIEKDTSYKILNKFEKDISWQILGLNQATAVLAWKIINEVDQITEWKIKKEKESDFAWKILNDLSLDTSFNILEVKSADLAYKIFNTMEKDTSWKIVSGVETKTIDLTATKRILDFNSEQKIYAFNSKTRTLIFYQKERK